MNVSITEAKAKDKVGLEDGGHVYISCSNCDATLMDIWRTMPNAINPQTQKPFFWEIIANCPFCGDKSYKVPVEGIFHSGGYGKIKEDDPEQDIPSTVVEDFNSEGNVITFNIKKASEDAKPIRR